MTHHEYFFIYLFPKQKYQLGQAGGRGWGDSHIKIPGDYTLKIPIMVWATKQGHDFGTLLI